MQGVGVMDTVNCTGLVRVAFHYFGGIGSWLQLRI